MEDIRRIYNLIVNLSKFTSNKKILSKVVSQIITNFVAKLYSLNNTKFLELFPGDKEVGVGIDKNSLCKPFDIIVVYNLFRLKIEITKSIWHVLQACSLTIVS